MPLANPSMGALAQLGFNSDATTTPAAATERYAWVAGGMALDREVLDQDLLRGSRLHQAERVRQGRKTPSGQYTFEPHYTDLAAMLPRIAGAAVGGAGFNTYTPSDTVPVAFQILEDKIAKVMTYVGCRTDKAVFKIAPGQALQLVWDIQALNESIGNAGTFAALSITEAAPFIFSDAVLTLGGTVYPFKEAEITLDWNLKKDCFYNNLTRQFLPSMDFRCPVKFTLPYTADETGLYDAGVTGVSGLLELTYLGAGEGAAGVSILFTFGNMIFPPKNSPMVRDKNEIDIVVEGEARRVGSTAPIAIKLDSTP